MKFKILKKTDFWGTVFGISGAVLVALNIGLNLFGFILFLCSSLLYSFYALKTNQKNLMFLNIVFSFINFIGIIRYF